MLAFLAALTADQIGEITALVGTWTPLLAVAAPFILGFAVRYDAVAEAKQAIAVVVAVAIAALTLAGDSWDDLTIQVVFARAGVAWLIAETAYRLVNGVLATVTPKGLNEWIAPTVSLVPGLRSDPEKVVRLEELRSAA